MSTLSYFFHILFVLSNSRLSKSGSVTKMLGTGEVPYVFSNDSECALSSDEIPCLRKLMREPAYASALVAVGT